jgi:hypothetical protein
MAKIHIPKSDQSQKTNRNYKLEKNGLTKISGNTGDGIRYLGGVSNLCRPVTPAMSPVTR